jgi:glucoside 3-dehydrogenase (cytochrome c) hitch-hiker subunit
MMFDRRGLMATAAALLGESLAAPLSRALAAEASPGFTSSRSLFTADQRSLVAAISERIIPTTDTPGAIAAGVPAFIEMMMADWYEPTDRNEFMNGLGLFDGYARIHLGKSFGLTTAGEQDAMLTLAMQGKIPALNNSFFYQMRQLVVLGYYSSEIGCKQERVYLPVPGRYDGHYPYAQVKRVFSA